MQQNDLIYCDEPSCKELSKMLSTLEDNNDTHKGHKTKRISVLRAELLEIDEESNPIRIPTTYEKEDLMQMINEHLESLQKILDQIMLNFREKLKMFVNDNLVSLRNFQLLSQAVLDDNQDLIKEYQSEIHYLKRDTQYFVDQVLVSEDVKEELVNAFESAKDTIQYLNEITLERPIIRAIPEMNSEVDQTFSWSSLNKHKQVSINGLSAKNAYDGYYFVLIDPQLNFQSIQTISLRIIFIRCIQLIKLEHCFISISDLKVLKIQVPDFEDLSGTDFDGDYEYTSNISKGSIWATDTYGQNNILCFAFAQGDIIDMQWNGPLKTFTTIKRSTGERFEFKVSLNADAEIYFGVGMSGDQRFEII